MSDETSKVVEYPTLKRIVVHLPESTDEEAIVAFQGASFPMFLVDYDSPENPPKTKEVLLRELVGDDGQGTLLLPSYDGKYATIMKYGNRLIATNDFYVAEFDSGRAVWTLLAIRGFPNFAEFFKVQLFAHEVHMQMLIRPGKGAEAVVLGTFVKATVPMVEFGNPTVIAGTLRAQAVHFSKDTIKALYGQAGTPYIFAKTDRRSFQFDVVERFFKCRRPVTRHSLIAQYWFNAAHEIVLL